MEAEAKANPTHHAFIYFPSPAFAQNKIISSRTVREVQRVHRVELVKSEVSSHSFRRPLLRDDLPFQWRPHPSVAPTHPQAVGQRSLLKFMFICLQKAQDIATTGQCANFVNFLLVSLPFSVLLQVLVVDQNNEKTGHCNLAVWFSIF